MSAKWYFFLLSLTPTNPAFLKNNFILDVTNGEICEDNNVLICPMRNFRVEHYNRTQVVFNMEMPCPRSLDKDIGSQLVIERWSDGGWRKVPFVPFKNDVCGHVEPYMRSIWNSFFKSLGVRNPEKCPIPAGNYTLRNFVVDTSGFKIPFWTGQFRITIRFTDVKTKRGFFCAKFSFKVEEVV